MKSGLVRKFSRNGIFIKTLEDGIQFIVQHDEGGLDIDEDENSGNGDTNLYVVSICNEPEKEHDGSDKTHVFKAVFLHHKVKALKNHCDFFALFS